MSKHAQPIVSPPRRSALMTVADVAMFLAVSRRQVYLLVERHELPTLRVGSRIRFAPEEIEAYLEGQHEAAVP
jgi:excisionase family DNA binding protein